MAQTGIRSDKATRHSLATQPSRLHTKQRPVPISHCTAMLLLILYLSTRNGAGAPLWWNVRACLSGRQGRRESVKTPTKTTAAETGVKSRTLDCRLPRRCIPSHQPVLIIVGHAESYACTESHRTRRPSGGPEGNGGPPEAAS
jgi:hypothetical protein